MGFRKYPDRTLEQMEEMIAAGLPPAFIVSKLGVGIEAVKARMPGYVPAPRPIVVRRRYDRTERIFQHIADYPNVSLFPKSIWKHW